jgi:DNA repair protein RecO (recombination protein O)
MARSIRVEAIVLRSFRFAEADRVLHLLTREHGRMGAVCKGVRRTRSRFGGRLEPLSRVICDLHPGRGELATVTGADLVASGEEARADPYRLAVALVGVEILTRLHPEAVGNERLFDGLARFVELAGGQSEPHPGARPARDPLLLAFGLKLLALAGWAPQLAACVGCGASAALDAYDVEAGGVVCPRCGGGFPLAPGARELLAELLARPLGEAVAPSAAVADQAGRVVADSVALHAGTRLRTLA